MSDVPATLERVNTSHSSEHDLSTCLDPSLGDRRTTQLSFLTNDCHFTIDGRYKANDNLSPEGEARRPSDASLVSKTHTGLYSGSHPAHEIAVAGIKGRSSSHNAYGQTEAAAEELLALRYPSDQTPRTLSLPDVFSSEATHVPAPGLQTAIESPFGIDGIFIPGSTYQELHTTLRNHIIESAKSDGRFRYEISDINRELEAAKNDQGRETLNDERFLPTGSPPSITLTRAQEYLLWKNYVEELGPWVCSLAMLQVCN